MFFVRETQGPVDKQQCNPTERGSVLYDGVFDLQCPPPPSSVRCRVRTVLCKTAGVLVGAMQHPRARWQDLLLWQDCRPYEPWCIQSLKIKWMALVALYMGHS
jgi:hypothetical protein|mmetsp:Transcript_23401/g.40296  ORF Transcript_23401/g.40296 Transcript_23401/m.40296 type:complete len:103 (-) Transcript_23401:1230-1538(-)